MKRPLRRASDAGAFTTLDGSTIREFMHPGSGLCAQQSLAEARVAPGARTGITAPRSSITCSRAGA